MENTCLDWLIALTYDYQLLGALAIAPNDQKLGIVSVHQQYLSVLAELEQESALQSIAEGNLGGNQIPSRLHLRLIHFLKSGIPASTVPSTEGVLVLSQRLMARYPLRGPTILIEEMMSGGPTDGIDLSPHMYLPLCLGDEVQVQVMVPLIGGYWADDKLLSSATSLMGGHDGARFAIGDTHIETQVLLAQSTSFPF
ncbi:hypothetical protein B0H14DRAFT_2575199 [Mycena olivaceomarginata]|nr:hypothetical protein B0H14DRAFT_2575199 [Mycena olivaceomarginata]